MLSDFLDWLVYDPLRMALILTGLLLLFWILATRSERRIEREKWAEDAEYLAWKKERGLG